MFYSKYQSKQISTSISDQEYVAVGCYDNNIYILGQEEVKEEGQGQGEPNNENPQKVWVAEGKCKVKSPYQLGLQLLKSILLSTVLT